MCDTVTSTTSLAEDRVWRPTTRTNKSYDIVARCKGADLAGWTYEPLFPYFADHANAFQVLTDDFVSTGDGTGIVHMAPAYGEDDYRICRAAGIEMVDGLDAEARFTARARLRGPCTARTPTRTSSVA